MFMCVHVEGHMCVHVEGHTCVYVEGHTCVYVEARGQSQVLFLECCPLVF